MSHLILQLLLTASLLWSKATGFVPIKPLLSRASSLLQSTPTGRVQDIDKWIQWSSDSLQQVHNQSLLELMNVELIEQVHTHKRYAVLSHGTQDDPIFCYSNVATREAFQYTEDEFYQLPSRYSAPGGGERQDRQKVMDDADNSNLWTNFSGIRQRSDKSLFEFSNVILWNVYNPEGVRVGQSAVFDKDNIEEVEKL